MEKGRTANTLSEIQKRDLQDQRMVATDNEKTDTGETLDRSQEGIVDTRTCRSDTDASERDTPPKQGEKDTWYTDTVVAIDKQRGSPLGMTQPVPASVAGNRAATRPASADTWHGTSAEEVHTDGTFQPFPPKRKSTKQWKPNRHNNRHNKTNSFSGGYKL
jgi:hypothetical protein